MKIVRNFKHLDIQAAQPRKKDGLRGPLTQVRVGQGCSKDNSQKNDLHWLRFNSI